MFRSGKMASYPASWPLVGNAGEQMPDCLRKTFGVGPLGQFRDYSPWTLCVSCPAPLTPTRSTASSAGYDLRSPSAEKVPAHGSVVIDTGIAVALPSNHYGKIEGRSGLGIKYNIVPFGGVIDQDYRGTIAVKLFNLGAEDYAIQANDRIAQMIVQPYVNLQIRRVDTLNNTRRGTSGFGSSGR